MEYFSKILHIDLNEDVQSVIERFSILDDHDIIFAIPAGTQIFHNPSELKLLKQAIDKFGKNVVLVSQDEIGLELARDIGFKVEEEFLELLSPSEESSERHFGRADVHKYSANTHKHPRVLDIIYRSRPDNISVEKEIKRKIIIQEESPKLQIEKLPAKKDLATPIGEADNGSERMAEYIRKEEPRKPKKKIITITSAIIIFVAISIIVATASVIIILPKATITILPKKETVTMDIPITADISMSEIDAIKNKIPGQIVKVEKEKTAQFKATGKTGAEGKAKGIIIIYNANMPPQDQALIKDTRFQTSDGKIFRIIKKIVVPSAKIENGKTIPGTIEAEVIADSSGPDYNILPSDFTIPGFKGTLKFSAFYGKSNSAMSGGSRGEGLEITLDDIEKAKKEIEGDLLETAKNELKEKLPKDLELVEDAIAVKILEEKVSDKAGATVENFSISLKVSAMAFLFKEDDMKSLIAKNIETKIMRDKIVFKDMRKKYGNLDIDFSSGTMTFNANIEQDIAAFFDKDALKNAFAGKNESEIRDYVLGQDLMDGAQVSFSPFWVKKSPSNKNKINIIIEE